MEPIPESKAALEEYARMGDDSLARDLYDMSMDARRVVPECVGLSLGLLQGGLTFTLVASSLLAAGLDAVQYLDGGPCVAGAHEPSEIETEIDIVDDGVTSEQQWRMYAEATAAAGVASSLTLPLRNGEQIVGTINLYASTADAFEGSHEELAAVLGASALGAVTNADVSFNTRLQAVQTPTRLRDQHDIDIAIGILCGAQDIDGPAAAERLHAAAARAGISEAQVARAIAPIFVEGC